jgi:hypothetical protein
VDESVVGQEILDGPLARVVVATIADESCLAAKRRYDDCKRALDNFDVALVTPTKQDSKKQAAEGHSNANELEAGLIEHSHEGYRATPTGHELYSLLVPLGGWAKKWAAKLPA